MTDRLLKLVESFESQQFTRIEIWPLAQYFGIQCMEKSCPSKQACIQHYMNHATVNKPLQTPNIMWDTNNYVYCSRTLSGKNHGRLTLTYDGLRCI